MPDTSILDGELLDNAEKKARRLSLNSFVVWNANEAALYVKDATDKFAAVKSWSSLGFANRGEVRAGRALWVRRLHQLLADINSLLVAGTLKGATPAIVLDENLFISVLSTYAGTLAAHLKTAYLRSARFAAEIDDWWASHEAEHPGEDKETALAKVNLVNWLNRFLFAHYLKQFNSAATAVEGLVAGTSVADAIAVFEAISARCDFMNVFKPSPGQNFMDDTSWAALLSFNGLLTDFRLESLDQKVFQRVLEGALAYSRKKMAGQFATPKRLAELLVRLTMENREAPVIDPCCGTGTIARAAYDLKREAGLPVRASLASTWGSDKYAFPLQLCSIALSDPMGMGDVVQVFKHDAFLLEVGQAVRFTDPNGGCEVEREVPSFHAVVSNLPFVRFENSSATSEALAQASARLKTDLGLSGKSDLYAYLIFSLRQLLQEKGRLGVVVSNAWLGTDWGAQFKEALHTYFHVKWVVVSGAGRWFSNAQVVTTLLILEKRTHAPSDQDSVVFVSTRHPLSQWDTEQHCPAVIAREVLQGRSGLETTQQAYDWGQLRRLQTLGVGWPALFSDVSWLTSVASCLVPAHTLFNIARGERRGWDPLFYPEDGHNIEAKYLKRVLKSSRSVDSLVAVPDGDAFCCSATEAELAADGSSGALAWIEKFKLVRNGTGKLLPAVLALGSNKWFEMKPTSMAELVVSMNPDKRLGVHLLAEPAFVNQRLIRFTSKRTDVDVPLAHALLNSSIGLFLLEAAGFGRGLGALDLNATKLAATYHMLNLAAVSSADREAILTSFKPLLCRSLMDLEHELVCPLRHAFDSAVVTAFGLDLATLASVRLALLVMYRIRQSARAGG